jgi:MtN3 and saliva related transmembrane protein
MEYIGYIATILTTVSFLPQVIHTIRVKDTTSVSLSIYSLFVVGSICWLAYGIVLGSIPIILANGITVILSGVIFGIKLKNVVTGNG